MKVIIEGKEIELELTNEQKMIVEKTLKSNIGWETVPYGEEYYFIGADVEIHFYEDNFTDETDNDYQNANYFSSKKLAENIKKAQTLQRQLWRRSAELCKKTDWWKIRSKHSIYYDYDENEIKIKTHYKLRDFGQIYFDTEEHAKQVIEEFKDELIWYFTEFKSRMD